MSFKNTQYNMIYKKQRTINKISRQMTINTVGEVKYSKSF